jgi:flagellar protein FliO/FliZ
MAGQSVATAAQAGPGLGGVWEVALGLALVVAVILAAAWAMRRMVPGATGAGAALRVVGALPLGPRERLLLVEVGGRQLLLGVTAQQISTLHSFDEPVVPPGGGPVGSEFAARLREMLAPGTRA